MIVRATAPTRLGLFGGGCDFPQYFNNKEALTVSLAINLRQRFTLYTDENLFDISGNKVPEGCSLDFVYAFREEFGINSMHHSRFDIDYDDIIESGLGSSAAAAVAMVGAISKSQGQLLTRQQIAEKAWEIEVNKLNLFGGKQDQYTSAYGGLVILQLSKKGINAISIDDKSVVDNLMPYFVLFHTKVRRKSSTIQEGFKKLTKSQKSALDDIQSLIPQALMAISATDGAILGKLLNQSWELKKRSNSGVSSPRIDDIYNYAMKKGAYGGKVCGAGGGGFMFFIVDPKKRDKFIDEMEAYGLEWFDFAPDYQGLELKMLRRK